MALKRAFYNSLLLSDSNVFIAGGMDYPVIFSDIGAVGATQAMEFDFEEADYFGSHEHPAD